MKHNLVCTVLQELGKFTTSITPASRQVACWLLGEFCAGSPSDFTEYVPMVVKDLMSRLHDEDNGTVMASVVSLDKVRRSCYTAHGYCDNSACTHSALESLIESAPVVRWCVRRTHCGYSFPIIPSRTVPPSSLALTAMYL